MGNSWLTFDFTVMKFFGIILSASFLLGIGMAMEEELDYCPEGSRVFVLNPNPDGTCPDSLPTVATPEEENENPCKEGAKPVVGQQKCGICIEFGDTGARRVESNPMFSEKCDMSCMDNGEPRCIFAPRDKAVRMAEIRMENLVPTDRWCLCCCSNCCNGKKGKAQSLQ